MPNSTSQPNRTEKAERLNKFLAFQLGVSRRQADNLIAKQKVYINNQPAQLGARIGESDTITINNHIVGGRSSYTYLMLNKPINYICSRKQQGKTPTIYSLLPDKFHNLKPVGRLDANSSGLLLLTNDGDFAFRMTHPKFKKNKQYNVTLDKELAPLHQQMIADFGIQLNDGLSKLGLSRQSNQDRHNWIVSMSEGRNRQIRRTFAALGYTVIKLHRTHFGTYKLGTLGAGDYIVINP